MARINCKLTWAVGDDHLVEPAKVKPPKSDSYYTEPATDRSWDNIIKACNTK